MSNFLEVKGKTIDEAIFKGLTEMGVSIDEVNIDILSEGGKGFLGLGKSALVRLTKKTEGEQATVKTVSAEPEKPAEEKHEEIKAEAEKPAEESAVKAAAPASDDARVAIAETFLDGLFENMGVPAKAKGSIVEEGISIKVTGDTTGILIGRRGETLDALQYLTSLNVNKGRNDYIRVVIDTENYRKKREETLVRLANRMAAKVEKSGRRMVLEPMNPYERRILHSALQNNPNVESISEGEDPYRRVVIRKKKQ